ncbi:Integral membrane family protein [Neofusicoccum parvum]|uniref:Integral membrane family protein n=1 Tax=Neofusicoccum parvum TaxID=310453 RepID=A0ACB5S7A1_9PEZI|nr:Integral membrane family protein [Neofusicoccum parvum]
MSSLPAESYHLNDSQRHLRVTLITCLTVAGAFVLLRVLVRLRIQRQFNPDDYLLLLAVCGFSLMTGFLVHAIDAGGFGRPTDELPLEVLLCGIKYLLFAKTSYVLTLIITNLSIALLQLRISGGVFIVFNRLHYTSIAINVVIGLYEFFRVLFQCFPVEKMWTPTMEKGHCADTDGITTGTYVYSAINVALTWYYALALVPLIWKLQLKTAVKLSSIFVLGVGILASVATIIRFKYLLDFSTTSNPLSE